MKQIALSWSGGKDSCMAFHQLIEDGQQIACLLTTVPEETGRTFAHDEETEKIREQAQALGIPLEFIQCTYDSYSEDFLTQLKSLKEKYDLDAIAFGDLYLQGHRDWGEKLASLAQLEAVYPLWTDESQMLSALQTFIQAGYQAEVIRVREDILPADWVGRILDQQFVEDIAQTKACPMGESGEYHTFVFDGPLFRHKVK